jgi:hypothetical protein
VSEAQDVASDIDDSGEITGLGCFGPGDLRDGSGEKPGVTAQERALAP